MTKQRCLQRISIENICGRGACQGHTPGLNNHNKKILIRNALSGHWVQTAVTFSAKFSTSSPFEGKMYKMCQKAGLHSFQSHFVITASKLQRPKNLVVMSALPTRNCLRIRRGFARRSKNLSGKALDCSNCF